MKAVRLASLIGLCIVLVAFAGCLDQNPAPVNQSSPGLNPANSTNASGVLIFTSGNRDFMIAFPASWNLSQEVSTVGDRQYPIAIFEPPDRDAAFIIATIPNIDPGMTPSTWASDFLRQAPSNWSQFMLINSTAGQLNSTPAQLVEFTAATPSGLPLHVAHIVTVKNGNAYILTYESEPASFEKYMGVASAMIGTFRFIPPG
jgi:hypothetical protein